MNAVADSSQDQSTHNQRYSLLELIEDKFKNTNRKTCLHRIIIIGKLRKLDSKHTIDLGDYYDKMFKNLQNDPRSSPYQEKVTGLIINYPTLMLHLVETSMDVIKILLRDIIEMCENPNGLISESKILNIAHNISVRLFPVYASKSMNLSLEYDSSDPAESAEVLINETIVRLLRLGKFLYDNHRSQFKKEVIDNIHEQHPEFLPNQNYVNFLMKNEVILKPSEFLEYNEKPLDIVLESELSWPAPFKLFSYN